MPLMPSDTMTRRRALACGLAVASAVALPGPARAWSAWAEDPKLLTFFRIGTGPTAKTLYSLGTAISAGISRPPGSSPCDEGGVCGVPGLIAVAQTREGSISSIRDLRDGGLESALVYADIAYWAYTQGGPFKDEAGLPDLRVIADLIPVSLHIVVRADSNIQSLRDMKGKSLSLGTKESGAARFVDVLLRSHGIKPGEFDAHYLRPGPAADKLLSGEIDAIFDMGAAPMAAIMELIEEEDGVRLLPVPETSVNTLRGFFPFLTAGTIPADAYPGIGETTTLKLGVQWVVRESTDPALVEAVTRALWQSDTAELFNLNNPGHRFPNLESGRQAGLIPQHPGAEAYYASLPQTG